MVNTSIGAEVTVLKLPKEITIFEAWKLRQQQQTMPRRIAWNAINHLRYPKFIHQIKPVMYATKDRQKLNPLSINFIRKQSPVICAAI